MGGGDKKSSDIRPEPTNRNRMTAESVTIINEDEADNGEISEKL
jgi:hypothetical protein